MQIVFKRNKILGSCCLFLILSILFIITISTIIANSFADKDENYSNSSDYKIFLQSRNFNPIREIDNDLKMKIKSNSEKIHVYIQFYDTPKFIDRKRLETEGIKLLSYIPNKAWFASISHDKIDKILELPDVRSISEIMPEDKISTSIKEKGFNNYSINKKGEVKIFVFFFDDISLKKSLKIISDHKGTVINYSKEGFMILLPKDSLYELAKEDSIKWIDQYYGSMLDNDGSRAIIGVNYVQESPYNLSGKDIFVGEWDGGCVDDQHYDLKGKVIQRYCNDSSPDHATHVAGTMSGNGNRSEATGGTSLQWRGMAPNASVISYRFWGSNIFEANDDYKEAINTYNISLSTNSWGTSYGGQYDYATEKEDKIIRGEFGKKILIMRSAGNGGPNWQTLRNSAVAKNIITVGAIDAFDESICSSSSVGPSSDGRIKPDLVAAGCKNQSYGNYSDSTKSIWSTVPGNNYTGMAGTSMSTPAISGSVALILEDWKKVYNQDILPSTIKAILIQTSKDLGNLGPDYRFGYGKINVSSAVNLINDYNRTNIKEGLIGEDEEDSFNFYASQSSNEIKLTLAWDDFPGDPSLTNALVNDLDLVLISPNGTQFYPWTLDPNNPGNPALKNQTDHLNNVEQIYINLSDYGSFSGTWIIKINGTLIIQPEQSYSIVSNGFSLSSLDPSVNKIECRNSSLWVNCSEIKKEDILTEVRVNCTSDTNNIVEAHFKLEVIRDNNTIFDNSYTSNDSNWWIFNNNDTMINGTGDIRLIVTCSDSANFSETSYESWHIPIPGEDSCGILDKEGQTYTLLQDVTSDGTCFNITANNITIDGDWHTIYYSKNKSGYGIYNNGYNFTNVIFLDIEMDNVSIKNSPGIYIRNSYGDKIYSSFLNISGSWSQDSNNHGIELRNTRNSYILYNYISTSSQKSHGIFLYSEINENSNNNIIEENIIKTTSGYAKGIYSWGVNGGAVNNLSLINNQIETLNTYSYGIHLKDESKAFMNGNYINSSFDNGILIESSNNNFVKNSYIISNNTYDVKVSGLNNTFLNSTYSDESVTGQLIRKWYLNVKVNETNVSNINQANVTGWNVSGAFTFSELTNSNGIIETQELIEYINNAGTKTYYTNYTVNVTKTNYENDSQSTNLTTNLNLVFTLESIILPNDTSKYYHKNSFGEVVAWLGNQGNIVLKGKCFFNTSCDNPGDGSLIFRNGSDYNLGFINITGDLCIIKGDCSDQSTNCSSPADGAFIRANSTDYVSYIDGEGDLCLVGRLYENADL